MGSSLLAKAIPAVLLLTAALVMAHWLGSEPKVADLTIRNPGQDGASTQPTTAPTDLRGTLVEGEGKAAADISGVWPWFRGPDLNNISTDQTPLARKWKTGGPIKLWSLDLGEGYAGPAVVAGRVYILDYDPVGRADVLRCLSLADGKEIWRRAYAVDVPRNHGMSRTVPAVTDKYVVTLGPKCHVVCLDAEKGEYQWGIDLVYQYKTKIPLWYAGQCPLIDGENVILAPGGPEALIMAVRLETGEVRWKTPNNKLRWKMTHSCVVPMTFKGKKMYVYCGTGGIVGVSAEDGAILWTNRDWRPATVVAAPLQIDEERILVSGYGAGCMVLRITESNGQFAAEPEFTRPVKVFGADQHTPILYRSHIYGVIPGGELVCLDLEGKQVWNSGSERYGLGLGPFIIADGMIILMDDSGVLSLVEATPTGFKPIAKAEIFENGRDSWGPFALVEGRLICRDMTRMACLDLRKASNE